jgi:hypothetical protein
MKVVAEEEDNQGGPATMLNKIEKGSLVENTSQFLFYDYMLTVNFLQHRQSSFHY